MFLAGIGLLALFVILSLVFDTDDPRTDPRDQTLLLLCTGHS